MRIPVHFHWSSFLGQQWTTDPIHSPFTDQVMLGMRAFAVCLVVP